MSRQGGVREGDGRREERGGEVERIGHCVRSENKDFISTLRRKEGQRDGEGERRSFYFLKFAVLTKTRRNKRRKAIREPRIVTGSRSDSAFLIL